MTPKELGKLGEKITCRYLEREGFRIVARNYYCGYGELDLVARDEESLVFVEVKSRTSDQGLEQAIGVKQIMSLQRSAQIFMQRQCRAQANFRFMVVYVLLPEGNRGRAKIKIVEDPF